MEPKHMGETLCGIRLEIGIAKKWQVVNRRCDVNLKQDIVIPVVFSVDLFEGNAVLLYPRMLRQCMDSTDTDKDLSHKVPQCDHGAHMGTPIVAIIMASQSRHSKGCQQQVLVVAHVLPWELVQQSRIRRHP
jgi:hypothetical protein